VIDGFLRRGEVYTVDFNPARGSEQAGRRPAVVVSNDAQNQHGPVVIVAAVTSRAPKRPYPFIVEIPAGVLPKDSYVLCDQLNTIDKSEA
jgi:mRNA interferase MazF